jgi:hypothetical protein
MMERCLELSMLTGLYGGGSAVMGGQPSLRPPGLGAEYRVFWLPGELESCARLMNRYMRRLHEPPHGDGLVLARKAGPAKQDEPMGPMTKLLMPALDRVFEMAAAAEARERLAQLAIAAAEHRAATGNWPTRATDIVPKYTPYLPLDPFTGKPLNMKAEGGDVIFYSVGNNRTDDGGARGKDIDEGDIVIHLSGLAGSTPAAGGSR